MDVSKTFDPYEVIGVITPGAVVALLLAIEWPELRDLMGTQGLSIGDLGLFILIAFVLGHLTQALGNVIDGLVWSAPGMPTMWVRSPRQTLISPRQRDQVQSKVATMEEVPVELATTKRVVWRSITSRMYTRVRSAGRSGRIDSCNRIYGMSRGLAAAFVAAAAWYWFKEPGLSVHFGVAVGLAIMAIYRMWRVSVHYARALFVEYVDLV